MPYQRILTVQDISCVGQCSMTVALPILSACGHEVCILPSALLSTHTGGFGKPAVTNLTGFMEPIWRHWQRENITFDAIYTGYLGSVEAISVVSEMMDAMLAPGGKVIVDPAMADHGKLYKGLDEHYAKAMTQLCMRADVMLPNLTEAAMMAGTAYCDALDEPGVRELLQALCGGDVVLTGAITAENRTGAAARCGGNVEFYAHDRIGGSFSGTGDIFAAAFTGAWMLGKPLTQAMHIAADFTCKCIQNTVQAPAHWYGVKFETALPDLIEMLK